MRLKVFCAILCLMVNGCASKKIFDPVDNCVLNRGKVSEFSCLGAAPYELDWAHAEDLVCFHASQFKAFNETCHEK